MGARPRQWRQRGHFIQLFLLGILNGSTLAGGAHVAQRAAQRLAVHHGSAVPHTLVGTMMRSQQWTCAGCAGRNGMTKDYCGSCGSHWQQWTRSAPSKRTPRRRRSASRQETAKKTPRRAYAGIPTAATAPWATATPTRTMMPVVERAKTEEAEETGTEQLAKLTKLREAMKEAGLPDNEEVTKLMSELEAGYQPKKPTLSHKKIAQVQKLENKLQVLQKKLQEGDTKWEEFRSYIQQTWQEQGEIFLKQRDELVAAMDDTKQALKIAQQQVQDASKALTEEAPNEAPPAPATAMPGKLRKGALGPVEDEET